MARHIKGRIYQISQKFTSLRGIEAIRRGLISTIPVLLTGALALTVKSFPIKAFQVFLTTFANGFFNTLLGAVYDATFGLLSLYMCISVGYHYATARTQREQGAPIGCSLSSAAAFVILLGLDFLSTDSLGPKGMFIAIVASLSASALFLQILSRLKMKRLLTEGADVNLNNSLRLIIPFAVTVLVFALINQLVLVLSGGIYIYDLFLKGATAVFSPMGDSFLGGLVFVVVSSLLWFFGIHGSDVLEGVVDTLFVPNIDVNIALVEAGKEATEILTKQFFDIFVLMGGCGSAMCLLLALLIFGKRRSNRSLAKMAAFPMIFNINEIMVFGLPIIYNPIMLIPFLCVPVVCFLTSYAAMLFGLVPMVTSPVEWTIPVIFGGYIATGSFMGSLLQIFNLALGVIIYRPFVKRLDEERLENTKRDYEHLVETMKNRESSREEFALTELPGSDGTFAKFLALEIEYALEEKALDVHYQPQFNLNGECFGAEALLRFQLPNIGTIYPPLVIELAKESGKLHLLEQYIFQQVKSDAEILWYRTQKPLKISINISGSSLQNKDFENFLIRLSDSYSGNQKLCIEITEQTAVIFNDELKERINRLRSAGFLFAIDDFSAGNTTLQYLQENFFDFVKLDGSIVQNCLSNARCKEVTATIIELSHNLGFKVIAEFVSSEEIRDCMAEAGCTMYQGWFYSPALPFNELEKLLNSQNEDHLL